MGVKTIYRIIKLYDKGRQIPHHNLAHMRGTLGSISIHDGHVSTHGQHTRPSKVARAKDLNGVPIEGMELCDAQVTKMDGSLLVVFGFERHEDVGIHHYGQGWWCDAVDTVETED